MFAASFLYNSVDKLGIGVIAGNDCGNRQNQYDDTGHQAQDIEDDARSGFAAVARFFGDDTHDQADNGENAGPAANGQGQNAQNQRSGGFAALRLAYGAGIDRRRIVGRDITRLLLLIVIVLSRILGRRVGLLNGWLASGRGLVCGRHLTRRIGTRLLGGAVSGILGSLRRLDRGIGLSVLRRNRRLGNGGVRLDWCRFGLSVYLRLGRSLGLFRKIRLAVSRRAAKIEIVCHLQNLHKFIRCFYSIRIK